MKVSAKNPTTSAATKMKRKSLSAAQNQCRSCRLCWIVAGRDILDARARRSCAHENERGRARAQENAGNEGVSA